MALAQEADHKEHHPDPAAQAAPPSMTTERQERAAAGHGMEERQGQIPAYPRMMQLPMWDARERAQLAEDSAARIEEGARLLDQARATLNTAITRGDHALAESGFAALRRASAQLQSGVAIHRALNDPDPSTESVRWLREQAVMPAGGDAHGLFGLTWFHYSAMASLAAFAAALLLVYLFRAKRASELAQRLLGGTGLAPPAPAINPAIAPTASNAWRGTLRVARVFLETPQVKTFRLVEPRGGPLPFTYLPGQFLTVSVSPEGRAVRRSYTIASSPTRRDACEITVRREPEGVVSRHLHDQVHEGALIEIVAPSGRFTFVGEEAASIVLIAGGVGITPMMSVVRYLTDRAWPGELFLIYAARLEADVIFREEIEHLARRYPNLHVTLVVEEAGAEWPHVTGRLSTGVLEQSVPQIRERRIHLCGPPAMMSAVKSQLAQLGVPANQVETEAFIGKERPATPAAPATQPVAIVRFVRSRKSARLSPEQSLLEAAEDVGVDIDFSCRAGVCGACKVKLLSGAVTMSVEDALTQQERSDNIVLACQARAHADVSVDA
jgi:ferredoxin-NADP reductase